MAPNERKALAENIKVFEVPPNWRVRYRSSRRGTARMVSGLCASAVANAPAGRSISSAHLKHLGTVVADNERWALEETIENSR
jgi:hypothetical protein